MVSTSSLLNQVIGFRRDIRRTRSAKRKHQGEGSKGGHLHQGQSFVWRGSHSG